MRIPVNLSSEPFRRDRPLVAASVVVGVVLAGLLAVLVSLAILERGRAAETRQDITRLQKAVLALDQEQARLEGTLRRPENAEVLDRVRFINLLLRRKGISWTKIFSDLENVMPHNVRLISIRPQVNARNEVVLDMVVGAQSQAPVIMMLKSLESSPLFGSTAVHNWLPPGQTEPLYRYRVSVDYGRGAMRQEQ
jgi:type IV pilus assembly protein PilN